MGYFYKGLTMPTYTVKSGDSLSGIASGLGLGSYNDLSGYKSGDPNLIYPGEVLSYGGNQAKSSSGSKPKSKSKPKSSGASSEQKAVNSYTKDLEQFDKNYESPIDIYNDVISKLGLSDVRTRVTDLQGALMDTENQIRNVEGSVAGRTQNSLVTESQKQRLVSNEQEPLADLYRTQGQQYELASGDYQRLAEEGRYQSDITYQGQKDERDNILDLLQIAVDNAKTAEEKKRWKKEFNQKKKEFKEDKRQYNEQFDYKKQQDAISNAKGSGGSGGSSSSSSKSKSKPTVKSLFEGYNPKKDKWYTEKVVIPELMNSYNYSQKKAEEVAYGYRKLVFGE